jgi:cytochrome oxidase Cu insertion factor (SCO1/SenC/PrrC family)
MRIRKTPVVAVVFVILALVTLAVVMTARGTGQQRALAVSPWLDPGTALHGPAPEFTLTDQYDRRVSLRSFRGRGVSI